MVPSELNREIRRLCPTHLPGSGERRDLSHSSAKGIASSTGGMCLESNSSRRLSVEPRSWKKGCSESATGKMPSYLPLRTNVGVLTCGV